MKIISMTEAADLFRDGDVVLGPGAGQGWPEELGKAVEKRFLETGHPCGMTNIHSAGILTGYVWAHEGLLAMDISSHESATPATNKLISENRLPAWYMPLGAMLQMYRDQGRGMPGTLSRVGLGTFMDPRQDAGCLNEGARKITAELTAQGREFIKYVPDFMGKDYLFYTAPRYTKAIMRATYSDEHGNISNENEVYNNELAHIARAVKAAGGTVIVQVEKITQAGQCHPKLVKVPCYLVDYVVVAEHPEKLLHGIWTTGEYRHNYWDSFTGKVRVPVDNIIEKMPFGPRKAVIRRACMEAKDGMMCNFGIGLPSYLGSVLAEEECMDRMLMISEMGAVGGIPGSGQDFGCHWNVEAAVDATEHFDWFDGTGLDLAVFGLSEVQENGSLNTGRVNGTTLGVGGFCNIALGSKISVFTGDFTARGLEEHIENGRLVIDREGSVRKFVKKSVQITFDADTAFKEGKKLLYITDRCVFEKVKEGLVLTEMAPGVDIRKHILDQMEFRPIIPAGGPKLMPAEIFREKWGGLKSCMMKD